MWKLTSNGQITALEQDRWLCSWAYFLPMLQNPVDANPGVNGKKEQYSNNETAKNPESIFTDQQPVSSVSNKGDKLQKHFIC